jgi:MFS transporter, PAT family, beta-lactamase induction signal transducer AmpG
VLLRESGLALPIIGLAQLLTLPWALKFVWAPFVDRVRAPRFGRRRAVIVPLQIANAIVLAMLALAATPGALWALCVAVLVVNLLSSTQDIATDGLAVEMLSADERGLGNGLQVGGYRAGMIIGGGAMLWVFSRAGWEIAFSAMAGAMLISTLPILFHRESAAEAPARDDHKATFSEIRRSFGRPGMRRWIAIVATYKMGEWFASGMLRTFFTDAKLSLEDIGLMLGVVGFSAALAGATLGGWLVTKLGRRRALIAFGIAQSLAIASIAVATVMPSPEMFYAVTIVEHVTASMATAALFTAMMDFSRPDHAGTDFTVQACVMVIVTGVASVLSGVSAELLGYTVHFLLAAGLSAGAAAMVVAYRPGAPAFALISASSRDRRTPDRP